MGQKKQQRRQAISDRLTQLKPEGESTRRGAVEIRAASDAAGQGVSIWKLDPAAVQNSRARRAFKALLEQVRALPPHPAILTVTDGGTDDGEGRPYLVTARVEGETLAQALERGPLPSSEALEVARDLLEGLAHAHARGLYHGALSPEQLLLVREEGRLRGRLVPFGFPRLAGPESETPWGPVRGEPEWAAPEVAKGEPVDATTDVYGAALLIQAMLTGQHPVPASPGKDKLASRLLGEAQELPRHTVSDPAREVSVREALRRALKKDPARRCAGPAELARALEPNASSPPEAAPLLPEGGPCAACSNRIPPALARTWDRHASDRPFRCPACREVMCGKVHWDARALSCKRCGERSAAANASQSDLQPVEVPAPVAAKPPTPAPAAPTPTPAAPTPAPAPAPAPPPAPATPAAAAAGTAAPAAASPGSAVARGGEGGSVADRQQALRELAGAARTDPPPAPRAASPATPTAASAPLTAADAVLEAWQSEKLRRETARARVEAARSTPQASALPAAVAAPRSARQLPPATALTPERLVVIAGAFVFLFLGTSWVGDHGSLVGRLGKQAQEHTLALERLEQVASENALAAGRLEAELDAARRQAGEEARRAGEATGELARVRAELEAAQAEARDLARRGARTAAALEGDLQRAQADVASARAQLASSQRELEAARTELQGARSSTEALRATEAAATARVRELSGKLEQAEAALRRLQAERDEAQRARTAAQARTDELARRVAELESRPAPVAPTTAPAAEGVARAGLALTPLGGEATGQGVPLGGPGPWPARAVVRASLASVRGLLERAQAGEAVVSVQVRLGDGTPALRLSGGAAAGGTAPNPHRPGRHAAPAQPEPGLARFWVSPALAAAWLAGAPEDGELVLLLEPAPGESGSGSALEASLVATPVGGDAALRLRELEGRAR